MITKQTQSEFRAGRGSVGTSSQQLTAVGFPARSGVQVANVSQVNLFVGHNSGNTIFELLPGASIEIPVDNSGKIWIKAQSGTQPYSWIVT